MVNMKFDAGRILATLSISALLIAIVYAFLSTPPYFIGDMLWYQVKGLYDFGIILSLCMLSLVLAIFYYLERVTS